MMMIGRRAAHSSRSSCLPIPHSIVRELEIGDYKGEESVTAILKQQQLLPLVRLFAITIDTVRYDRLEGLLLTEKQNRCCERLNVHIPFRVNVMVSED
jgi:hypothetical protein